VIVFSDSSYERIEKWETNPIFKEDKIDVNLAGASVTKTATLFGVLRVTVSKVM
jgi:hypothetical protein